MISELYFKKCFEFVHWIFWHFQAHNICAFHLWGFKKYGNHFSVNKVRWLAEWHESGGNISDETEGNISMESWLTVTERRATACSDQEESAEDIGKQSSVHFFVAKLLWYAWDVLENAFLGGSLTISHKYSIFLRELLPFACCCCFCHNCDFSRENMPNGFRTGCKRLIHPFERVYRTAE